MNSIFFSQWPQNKSTPMYFNGKMDNQIVIVFTWSNTLVLQGENWFVDAKWMNSNTSSSDEQNIMSTVCLCSYTFQDRGDSTTCRMQKILSKSSQNPKTMNFFMLQESVQFSSVQSLSRVRLFATPRIAALQASLSIANSWSSLRLTSAIGINQLISHQ